MNNYYSFRGSILDQKKQKRQRFSFESIGINHYNIKKRNYRETKFLGFIIWNIVFFSLISFVSASTIASFVGKLHEDSYDDDAFHNAIFPTSLIFCVILLNFSRKSRLIENVVLPLLYDVLYNAITWMIPLVVSFSFDELLSIKIFSIVNMCLHINCAIITIIDRTKSVECSHNYYTLITFFLFFPVIVIPILWTNIVRDIVSFFYISYTMPIYMV
jgi:hypothetical protein